MSEKLCTLRTKGGGGGKYTETSLWTNPSPSANFAAQTVSLSDSIDNYKYIKIKYCFSASYNTGSYLTDYIISVDEFKKVPYPEASGTARLNFSFARMNTSNVAGYRRFYYASNTTVRFGSTDTNALIPLEILGLNELAHGGNVNPVTIGTYPSLAAQTIDVSQILPNDYQNLTIDNFYIKNAKIAATSSSGSATALNNIISSYNPSTGILNCNASYWTNGGYIFYINYTISAVY